MQIFVLGMHRSGTSALARVLNFLGCRFGVEETRTGANEESARESWERRDVRRINDEVLLRAGNDWSRVSDFDPSRIDNDLVSFYQRSMAEIVRNMDAHRPWFVNEPRLCLTFPLWRPVLEMPVCIHIFRNPLAVARSLETHNAIPIPAGLALWERYNASALEASKGTKRLAASYERLMSSPLEVVRHITDELQGLGYEFRQPQEADPYAFLDHDPQRQRGNPPDWRSVASESQRDLYEWLVEAESSGLETDAEAPGFDPSNAEALREYERLAGQTVVGSSPAAARPATADDAQARIAKLVEELSRYRARQDSLEREAIALTETLRNKDRELHLAATEKTRQKRHIVALERLLDEAIEDVRLILSSRRWRLGNTVLSFHRWLLGRHNPPTAVDHLLESLGKAGRYRFDRSPATGKPAQTSEDVNVATQDPREMASPRHRGMASPRHVTEHHHPPAAPTQARNASTARAPVRPSRVTVLVLAWDVGHNPLGRAYLLAEALSRSYEVVLAGFQFPRYGKSVWKPLRGLPFRIVSIPGSSFPDFQQTLDALARRVDADVVIACKGRLPSIQAGLMIKAVRNRPLIVDIDDYELAFFQNREPLDDPSTQPSEALQEPFEEAWTRYAENLLGAADRILVSNPRLQNKFGGVVVPHARDERSFRPDRIDRTTARKQLGLEANLKVVMFVGTPRPHKGVLEVLAAVKQAGKRHPCCFVIVGKPPDMAFEEILKREGGDTLRLIPDQPFHRLPGILAAADLVCVLQNPDDEIADYQFPAKIVDAMAMEVPVLATDVPPLKGLIEQGAIDPVTRASLAERIAWWLDVPEEDRAHQVERARAAFLASYSYRAISRTLVDVVEGCLAAPCPLPGEAVDFLNAQADRYPCRDAAGDGLDVVMFWKQGDTGLYGRRFDMLVDRLARHPDIRRIAVFDAPFSVGSIWEDRHDTATTHHREVCGDKLIRRWGLADGKKVSHHVFLFDNHGRLSHGNHPPESYFPEFVADELEGANIDPRESVFWYCPLFREIEAVDVRFKPRLKVVDVIDDQRTWSERSDEERLTLTHRYRTMLADADIAFANCETVREAMSAFAPDIAVLPNGFDLDPVPEDPDGERFARFLALEGPLLGLAGNLEAKTDTALLERLARERPNYQLVLVGSTHTYVDIRRLDEYDNVFFAGVVRYPEVKTWIKRFDVALLPHLDTEQTRSMHPLKLLVYASLGVRTVATRGQNLGDLEPFVDVADDHDAFLKAVDNAVAGRNPPDANALKETMESNSWERRVDEIMSRIHGKLRHARR